MEDSLWLGMGSEFLNWEHGLAMGSELAVVRDFVEAHPERLNKVRSDIKRGRRRKKGRGEGEELTIMGMLLACK